MRNYLPPEPPEPKPCDFAVWEYEACARLDIRMRRLASGKWEWGLSDGEQADDCNCGIAPSHIIACAESLACYNRCIAEHVEQQHTNWLETTGQES
jgi:hypothetical protein